MRFECPYLGQEVELTDERLAHIEVGHSEVMAQLAAHLSETLRDPDAVLRRDARQKAFARRFPDSLAGRHFFVVVLTDEVPSEQGISTRHWVVTAYIVRRLPGWTREWSRG